MRVLLGSIALFAGAVLVPPNKHVAAQPQAKPDLVVALAIDQFGSLLLERWRGSYTGGLKRLSTKASFTAMPTNRTASPRRAPAIRRC